MFVVMVQGCTSSLKVCSVSVFGATFVKRKEPLN